MQPNTISMTKPRIEEIAGEVWRLIKEEWEEKDGKLPSGWSGIGSAYGSYSRLIDALTQAHQAGIDEAEIDKYKTISKMMNELLSCNPTQLNEALFSYRDRADDKLEALQDNK